MEKDYNELTPIELNHLLNKNAKDHDKVKDELLILLDQVKDLEEVINKKIDEMKNLENEFVKISGILIEKK